jgi:hypothetical protein
MRQPPIIKVIFSQPDEAYNTSFATPKCAFVPKQEPLSKRSDFGHSRGCAADGHAECRFTTQAPDATGSPPHFAASRHW